MNLNEDNVKITLINLLEKQTELDIKLTNNNTSKDVNIYKELNSMNIKSSKLIEQLTNENKNWKLKINNINSDSDDKTSFLKVLLNELIMNLKSNFDMDLNIDSILNYSNDLNINNNVENSMRNFKNEIFILKNKFKKTKKNNNIDFEKIIMNFENKIKTIEIKEKETKILINNIQSKNIILENDNFALIKENKDLNLKIDLFKIDSIFLNDMNLQLNHFKNLYKLAKIDNYQSNTQYNSIYENFSIEIKEIFDKWEKNCLNQDDKNNLEEKKLYLTNLFFNISKLSNLNLNIDSIENKNIKLKDTNDLLNKEIIELKSKINTINKDKEKYLKEIKESKSYNNEIINKLKNELIIYHEEMKNIKSDFIQMSTKKTKKKGNKNLIRTINIIKDKFENINKDYYNLELEISNSLSNLFILFKNFIVEIHKSNHTIFNNDFNKIKSSLENIFKGIDDHTKIDYFINELSKQFKNEDNDNPFNNEMDNIIVELNNILKNSPINDFNNFKKIYYEFENNIKGLSDEMIDISSKYNNDIIKSLKDRKIQLNNVKNIIAD